MIIGRINGKDATPSDFHKYFSQNKWSPENVDYFKYDSFYPESNNFEFTPSNADIPQQGDSVTGYRVFTYMEGEEDKLGSPVSGYMTHMDTMFGNPQRRDSVNIHPEGRGYYYFPDKGVALAFAEYLLRDEESIENKPDYSDQPLHVMVSRVEGTYINKYMQDEERGQYGERMDNMKTVDEPLIDINTTKLNEAYRSTAKVYTEIIHDPNYATDMFDEKVTIEKGPRALNLRNLDKYHNTFERVDTVRNKRFMEKHPAVLLGKLKENNIYRSDISFGHYDMSRYSGLFSNNLEERRKAKALVIQDLKELKELYPDRDIPSNLDEERW